MNKCQVCEKHESKKSLPGGVIFENESVFVAHFPLIENEPAHKGHVILEMKRHITQMSELTEAEALEVGRWTRLLSIALQGAVAAEHVYLLRIGDVTPHLHFHFVPRYADAPKESWGPLHFKWERGPKASSKDMIEISDKIRELLRTLLR
jgi:histidine triad (HIT) family protein